MKYMAFCTRFLIERAVLSGQIPDLQQPSLNTNFDIELLLHHWISSFHLQTNNKSVIIGFLKS